MFWIDLFGCGLETLMMDIGHAQSKSEVWAEISKIMISYHASASPPNDVCSPQVKICFLPDPTKYLVIFSSFGIMVKPRNAGYRVPVWCTYYLLYSQRIRVKGLNNFSVYQWVYTIEKRITQQKTFLCQENLNSNICFTVYQLFHACSHICLSWKYNKEGRKLIPIELEIGWSQTCYERTKYNVQHIARTSRLHVFSKGSVSRVYNKYCLNSSPIL